MSAKLALMPSGHRHRSLPQSSSASRFTAGAFGFFILSQPGQPWALACLRAARSHRGFAQATFSRSQEWNQSACHGLRRSQRECLRRSELMPSRVQEHKVKARECERRAEAAEDPGVRKAYRRVAAEWSDMASQVKQPTPKRRRLNRQAA